MAEKQASRQAKYLERNGLVQINMCVPIEVRDRWRHEAICRGMSVKQMIIGMINAYLDYEKMERKRAINEVYGLIARSKEGEK